LNTGQSNGDFSSMRQAICHSQTGNGKKKGVIAWVSIGLLFRAAECNVAECENLQGKKKAGSRQLFFGWLPRKGQPQISIT
jgi:hypothetical protein